MKWESFGWIIVLIGVSWGIYVSIPNEKVSPPPVITLPKPIPTLPIPQTQSSLVPIPSLSSILQDTPKALGTWLYQQGYDLNPQVIDVLKSIIEAINDQGITHTSILTLIDYSLPANQKRLWVIDLMHQNVLFHTYVSHGLTSGTLESKFFSNRFNSKASSIGVYLADKPYYGRHGLSLKLNGLDQGFNDNADARAVVIHGGWYVEENFIQKYGRAGRSWGCPAVPDGLISPIIDMIKNDSIIVIYYPDGKWLTKSKFIQLSPEQILSTQDSQLPKKVLLDNSEDVLFAQLQKKNKHHQTEAIMVTPATNYTLLFHKSVPLERMLRRQIEAQEYVALSKQEFDQMLIQNQSQANIFDEVYFVVPEIKMVRGYYATEMNKLSLGKIMQVNVQNEAHYPYMITMDSQSSFPIKTTHQFIRWLGL